MIGILAGTLIGVVLGTISGLVPGIHVNTFAGVLLGFQFVLIPVMGPEILAATMIAALVTHTFLDSVPSTFLVYLTLTRRCRFSLPMHSAWKGLERRQSGYPPWEVHSERRLLFLSQLRWPLFSRLCRGSLTGG